MTNVNLAEELEKIIDKGLKDISLPVINSNSIRIKNIVIRKKDDGYLVFDVKKKKKAVNLFSKTAAVALAKSLANGRDRTDAIVQLDKEFEKNFLDSIFYKNMLKHSDDEIVCDSRQDRLDIAIERVRQIKQSLDRIIFV